MYKKSPETPIYHFHNANPKGKNASDCVYRALSVALDQDYAATMREMTEFALKNGYAPNEDKLIKIYLESKGWTTCKEPRNHENKKITVARFIQLYAKADRTYVIFAGSHHTSVIVDGKVWDTWDCTKKTMHRYWIKL